MILASISDLDRLKVFFNSLDKAQPSTFIFFTGQGDIIEAFAKEHSKDFKKEVVFFDKMDMKVEPNKIYFADFQTNFFNISKKYSSYPCSLLVFGNISTYNAKLVSEWKNIQLLAEDLGDYQNKNHPLKAFSTDVVPATSFAYMSCRYLSNK